MRELLPEKFHTRISEFLRPSECNTLMQWLSKKKSVTIRINSIKGNIDEVLSTFRKKKMSFRKSHTIDGCYFLENTTEKQVEKLDIYKDWLIYMQNMASQVPVTFLWAKKNETILDITAAPWSKTTQLSALMKNTGLIIANEKDPIRYERLCYNIHHLWCSNIKTVLSDATKIKLENIQPYIQISPSDLVDGVFDRILADLPCSAEGRIHLKNKKSFWYWSEKNIEKHAKLQRKILSQILPLLKKGWEIVYSTCTLAPEENEEIVDWLIKEYKLELIPITLEHKNIIPGITEFQWKKYVSECKNTLRCIPWNELEGFYIAKLRKN